MGNGNQTKPTWYYCICFIVYIEFILTFLLVAIQTLLEEQCCVSVSKEEETTRSEILSFGELNVACYHMTYCMVTQTNFASIGSAVRSTRKHTLTA